MKHMKGATLLHTR